MKSSMRQLLEQSYNGDEVIEYIEKLEERATPKPIVLKDDGFYCPTCGAKIEGRLFYAHYCNECGQALGGV